MRRFRHGGADGASPAPSRSVVALVASGAVLGLLVALGAASLAWNLRQRQLQENGEDLARLSFVLAEQTEQSLQSITLLQRRILEEVRNGQIDTPEAFRQRFGSPAFNQALHDRIDGLPQINELGIVDNTGQLVNFSRGWPIPAVNVGDRDYFHRLSGEAAPPYVISRPMRSRSSGNWTIFLARRASAPDGTLLGLVLGAIELSSFEKLYSRIATEEGLAITLVRRDGVLLARFPARGEITGQAVGTAERFQQLLAGGEHSVTIQNSLIDDQSRLMAVQALPSYPMGINVSQTLHAALAEWRQEAAALALAVLLIEGGIAGMVVLGLRQLRAQGRLAEAWAERAEAGRAAALAELALAREREAAEREARLKDRRFARALDAMGQGLCMFDAAGRLLVHNATLHAMLQLPPEALQAGMPFEALEAALSRSTILRPGDAAALVAPLREASRGGRQGSFVWRWADGRSFAVTVQPATEEGSWLASFEEVTERLRAEQQILHMAQHDALTGLANRTLLHERLRQAAAAAAARGERCALLCLDLDHFKVVNDTLGHPVGDALLQEVARRLGCCVRDADTAARLGGDEFAVLQTGISQPGEVAQLAQRLIEELSRPYEIGGRQLALGVSIGSALAPEDGETGETLLRHADFALYSAKAEGRGRHRVFEPAMNTRMQARLALEAELRRALEEGEFHLLFQPLLSLPDRQVVGFEALLRWRHPRHGLMAPDSFIPLAEETGLIVPIGHWVLREACREMRRWPGHCRVAVNLSPVQLADGPALLRSVEDALAASGEPAGRLELEITESAMLRGTEEVLDTLRRLKERGVRLAMDDFGTGYSSLGYLRTFPFDKVKIDRSFVRDLPHDGESRAIVHAVIGLCGTLGLTVTAEGVETEEQLAQLQRENCSEVQGYLFGAPQPAEEALRLVRGAAARRQDGGAAGTAQVAGLAADEARA
ncbi:bifunctional diguanylate cyclase/phosphodiesterase [Roseomonas elaeocarpi]|uniref:EAL domain-containing protein n=1 Tax=Roseomonas elaeocarpi TaxID=907779 RepID=A0ABV6JNW7_9PROT